MPVLRDFGPPRLGPRGPDTYPPFSPLGTGEPCPAEQSNSLPELQTADISLCNPQAPHSVWADRTSEDRPSENPAPEGSRLPLLPAPAASETHRAGAFSSAETKRAGPALPGLRPHRLCSQTPPPASRMVAPGLIQLNPGTLLLAGRCHCPGLLERSAVCHLPPNHEAHSTQPCEPPPPGPTPASQS